MIQDTFVSLVYNAALLLALGIIFDSMSRKSITKVIIVQITTGIILGAVTLAIMINPWVLKPGVVFDTRSIILSLTGMFFGIIPSVIAGIIALSYRIWLGGHGVYTGCSVIVASILWGNFWRVNHKFWKKPYGFLEFYSLGIVNHVTMLALMLLMPKEIWVHVLSSISLPVIIIYPFVTVLLGYILVHRMTRLQEKDELVQSESKFRDLYQNAPIAYQSLDIEGNFITVNQTWLETMGYRVEEVVGKNFIDFLHPSYRQVFALNFPKFKAQGHIEGVEFIMQKSDGSDIYASFNGTIVYNPDGSFKQTQCVFSDITERRQHENALRSIEWMLTKSDPQQEQTVSFGSINGKKSIGVIARSVGKETLTQLINDYLALLDSSSVIIEKNGDYAIGMLSSAWCKHINGYSANAVDAGDINDNEHLPKSLCHESRWQNVAEEIIKSGKAVDRECSGGLRLFGVPICTSSDLIGAILFGYGSPPTDDHTLNRISEMYGIPISELRSKASIYHTRPRFIIEQAKRKLYTSAKIIGEIVERKQAEEQRNRYAHRLEILRELDSILLKTLSLESVCMAAVEHLQKIVPFDVLCVNVLSVEDFQVTALLKPKSGFDFLRLNHWYSIDNYTISALKEKETFVILNDKNKEQPCMLIQKNAIDEGMQSFMYSAMILQDDLLGFLWFASSSNDAFNAESIEIATEFADQFAIVLHHLQLIDTIKNHAGELERIVEERTAQLKIANKEMEAFSYSIAHDLRSPLRIIDGYCDILQEDYAPHLPDEAKKVLFTIRDSTQKMDVLIKEILELAKLNTKTLKFHEIDMQSIVEEMCRAAIDAYRDIEFTINIDDIPDCVGDYALIRQVWQNLIENAVKFTHKSSLRSIQINAQKNNHEIVYCVKDSGVGFDMAYADKIFGTFQRLHSTKDFAGTGIGLALVKKIIDLHHGRIWAESSLGIGTCVYFAMPTQQRAMLYD